MNGISGLTQLGIFFFKMSISNGRGKKAFFLTEFIDNCYCLTYVPTCSLETSAFVNAPVKDGHLRSATKKKEKRKKK